MSLGESFLISCRNIVPSPARVKQFKKNTCFCNLYVYLFFMNCLTLKMNAAQFFNTLETPDTPKYHTPKDLNPPIHHRQNLKSCSYLL